MKNEQRMISKEGYQKLLYEIEMLEKRLAEYLNSSKNDNHHFSLYTTTDAENINQITILKSSLHDLYHLRDNAIIIDNEKEESETVSVGDIINITISIENSSRKMTQNVKLIDRVLDEEKIPGLSYATINSPLGRAILGHSVGEVVKYQTEISRSVTTMQATINEIEKLERKEITR